MKGGFNKFQSWQKTDLKTVNLFEPILQPIYNKTKQKHLDSDSMHNRRNMKNHVTKL